MDMSILVVCLRILRLVTWFCIIQTGLSLFLEIGLIHKKLFVFLMIVYGRLIFSWIFGSNSSWILERVISPNASDLKGSEQRQPRTDGPTWGSVLETLRGTLTFWRPIVFPYLFFSLFLQMDFWVFESGKGDIFGLKVWLESARRRNPKESTS